MLEINLEMKSFNMHFVDFSSLTTRWYLLHLICSIVRPPSTHSRRVWYKNTYQGSSWSSQDLVWALRPATLTAPLLKGSANYCWTDPGRWGFWCTWSLLRAARWAGCCANREVSGWGCPWEIPTERRWGHSHPDGALPGCTVPGNCLDSRWIECWRTSTGIPGWRGSWRLRLVSS